MTNIKKDPQNTDIRNDYIEKPKLQNMYNLKTE